MSTELANRRTLAFEVCNVSKTYGAAGEKANDNISLQIPQGDVFGIIGANGAGKSTLLRQMMGLIPSDSGTIRIFGRDIGSEPLVVQEHVGYMAQHALALANITVYDALVFSAKLRGLVAGAREEAERVIAECELESITRKMCHRLSGGEARIAALAVALVGSAPVLLLDEPTNDLDPARRKQVWDLLRERNRSGATVIFITHDAAEAEKIVKNVAVLSKGRVVAQGAPRELLARLRAELRVEAWTTDDRGEPVGERHMMSWERATDFLLAGRHRSIERLSIMSATLEDLHDALARDGEARAAE